MTIQQKICCRDGPVVATWAGDVAIRPTGYSSRRRCGVVGRPAAPFPPGAGLFWF